MNRSKRILIVANVTWNVYNFRLNFLEILIDQGWDVHLAAVPDEYVDFINKYPEVSFTPLESLRRTSKNPLQDARFAQELYSLFQKVKPDISVHYTIKPNIYAGMVARMLNIDYYSIVTGLGYSFIHNGWLESLTSVLYKIGLKASKQVIFENNDDRTIFIEKKIIRADQGVTVNGCGVDVHHFKSMGIHRDQNKFIFAYIGRLLYDKGLNELIEAFIEIKIQFPQAELWLIGKRDKENPACISEQDFATWIEMESIFYKGYTEDVRPFIDQSDCIVYPSYREGMPRLVLEAMSMERPIITTDVAGCRETIIDGEHGYIVPVRDEVMLAKKMKEVLLADPIDLGLMGQRARRRAIGEFNHLKIANDLVNIINENSPVHSNFKKEKRAKSLLT